MKSLSSGETALRAVFSIVLWLLSSALTAHLFLVIAGDDLGKRIVLLALAFSLDGTKILTWRMGGKAKVLSVALIVLSVIASLGAALETVEAYRLRGNPSEQVITRELELAKDLESIQAQIDVMVIRLEALPLDYVSAAKQSSHDIAALRVQKEALQLKSVEMQEAELRKSRTMFDLLADSLGIKVEKLLLFLLLFMALCLEISALVLAQANVSVYGTGYPTEVTTEAFLAALMAGADVPVLHGRDTTAKKLGIRPYEAKVHIKRLLASGTIVVKGKRLELLQRELSGNRNKGATQSHIPS